MTTNPTLTDALQRYEPALVELDEEPESMLDYMTLAPAPDGDWVKHADALALIAELREALASNAEVMQVAFMSTLYRGNRQSDARAKAGKIQCRLDAIRALLTRTEGLSK